MRKSMAVLLSACIIIGALGSSRAVHAQEASPLGLTAGVEFWNNYFWRGLDFFGAGNGVFFPYVYFGIGKTGLSLMYMGQYGSETLGDGTGMNDTGREQGNVAYNGAHWNMAYTYTVEKVVAIGVSGWYYWFYNSDDKLGYKWDWWEGTASATILALPLNPTISYTYDYFVDKDVTVNGERGKNHYIKLALGHSFKLGEGSQLGLGLSAAYFDWNSMEMKGISDVVASAKLSTSASGVSFNGSINYAYIPSSDFNNNAFTGNVKDTYRWWATFGASYSL
ncbi:MAG TPA: hypothetical protein PLZ78_15740 [Spirochaetota bacterium]|nr:hypothetical protein [Spirochaetota bacterium]